MKPAAKPHRPSAAPTSGKAVARKAAARQAATGQAAPDGDATAAPPLPDRGSFLAPPDVTLAAALRGRFPDQSWSALRRLCISGKISIGGETVTDHAARLTGGETIEWRMSARDARRAGRPSVRIVHEDVHLVLIDKPQGVSTVPFDRKETGTALDLIRDAWRLQGRRATATPLYVVHRIDKDTSGLVVFAKTKLAERGLHQVFKNHLADRTYLAVAHGDVRSQRIESRLVPDRGDGIRGSLRAPQASEQGQLSVTNVVAEQPLRGATLCRVQLETGRTHQIRIHLSEAHHPLVGETVYIRDLLRAGGKPISSPRLLLHAHTLGFEHPITRARLAFESPLPPDYLEVLERLRR